MTEANGELTREILRAELRAGLAEQTISLRREMDTRFEPVNEFISAQREGTFTQAQESSIVKVIEGNTDSKAQRRNNRKFPVIALALSSLATFAAIALTVVTSLHVV